MFPTVAEVIFIGEAFVLAEFEIAQLDEFRVLEKADTTVVVHTIVLALDVKQVEVLIAPAESDLQGMVEVFD